MSNLYWLSEAQMARLRPYFPKSRGRARVYDQRVLVALFSSIAMGYVGVMRLWRMGR
jgi:transposase